MEPKRSVLNGRRQRLPASSRSFSSSPSLFFRLFFGVTTSLPLTLSLSLSLWICIFFILFFFSVGSPCFFSRCVCVCLFVSVSLTRSQIDYYISRSIPFRPSSVRPSLLPSYHGIVILIDLQVAALRLSFWFFSFFLFLFSFAARAGTSRGLHPRLLCILLWKDNRQLRGRVRTLNDGLPSSISSASRTSHYGSATRIKLDVFFLDGERASARTQHATPPKNNNNNI